MTPLFIHSPGPLLYWLGVSLDGKPVTDDVGVNSWHGGGRPCEYVSIFGHELFEQRLLPRVQARADSEGSLGVMWVYPNNSGSSSVLLS